MATRTGNLPRGQANWMTAHGAALVDTIPRPRCRWRWGEVEVDRGRLQRLRDFGLIERDGERWRTTRRCIRAIADYQSVPVDEVGARVGQQTLGGRR